MQRVLRVGSPPYLVARPIDMGLERESGIELVREVPAKLVDGLRAGRIDVALVSSIELFRHPGYRHLSGIAVLGRGKVSSVQLFLRRRLEDLATVVLDPASRAAQALLRVMLSRRLGRDAVRYLEPHEGSDPEREAERHDAGGWLQIGDPALKRVLGQSPPPTFDPAGAWVEDFRLPFAFAVWVVRPGIELDPHHDVKKLHEARDRGAQRIEELAREASRELRLPYLGTLRYLREECGFDAGPELERSLYAFRDAAAELGLCRGDLALDPIRPAHVAPAHRG